MSIQTPTLYWQEINKELSKRLVEHGYENFKSSSAVLYNDDYRGDLLKKDFDTKELWESLYSYIPAELLDGFSEPMEGNPHHLLCNGRPVTIDLGCSIRESWLLAKHIDLKSAGSIVEVGGGYGRTAYVMHKLYPEASYTMCDIEPSLSLQRWYLTGLFKDDKLDFISPIDLHKDCDLLIAINCLHEMNAEQIEYYFDYASKHAKYFYYVCWYEGNVPFDGLVWRKEDYPVKSSWEEVFCQPHPRDGFFEVLYKI